MSIGIFFYIFIMMKWYLILMAVVLLAIIFYFIKRLKQTRRKSTFQKIHSKVPSNYKSMGLKEKSQELKTIVSSYDAKWWLGDLAFVMHSGKDRAQDQLENLSSPMRQLYYLAGLNISTDDSTGVDFLYRPEKWEQIVTLLNQIEAEYVSSLTVQSEDIDFNEWKKVRDVAIPSFLSYFNVGPLNFEEQILNWVADLYPNFDEYLLNSYNLTTKDFTTFYENLDKLVNDNFQGHSMNEDLLRENWSDYTTIESGVDENMPEILKKSIPKHFEVMSKFMIDKGMKDRFYPSELVSEDLTIEKVNAILNILSIARHEREFLYYTETNPGNPILDNPILNIGNGMYQVFEVKRVIHAISSFLEKDITSDNKKKDRYVKLKGALLENNILELFKKLFGKDAKIFQSYYINGNEQDILILWNNNAFIIEAKGYNLREPFRNPEKAYARIKDDFNSCIGYGYKQTRRVEEIIENKLPLEIYNDKGVLIETIDTSLIKNSFSIIVNLDSFGLVQNDLSYLLQIGNEDIFPWAVKFDDLEIFVLTLIAQGKRPDYFVDFLLFRETLHGKVLSSDELEICGGYLTKQINPKQVKYVDKVVTLPEFGDIFDEQYRKTMGFKNEKYLYEKQSGKFMFW